MAAALSGALMRMTLLATLTASRSAGSCGDETLSEAVCNGALAQLPHWRAAKACAPWLPSRCWIICARFTATGAGARAAIGGFGTGRRSGAATCRATIL